MKTKLLSIISIAYFAVVLLAPGQVALAVSDNSKLFTFTKTKIETAEDGREFCINLPGGVSFTYSGIDSCAYTPAGSVSPCQPVPGSVPSASQNCRVFRIENVVGQDTNAMYDVIGYGDVTAEASAAKNPPKESWKDVGTTKIDVDAQTSGQPCGADGQGRIDPVIDLGCKGVGNPILDITFAVMRFLSVGAGLVIIGSMIVAGIQYTASKGDPQATGAAMKRIVSNASALAFFVFAYAILNWVVPNGVLQ